MFIMLIMIFNTFAEAHQNFLYITVSAVNLCITALQYLAQLFLYVHC